MVDTDGDGQVSFEEFHRLVIDPDPSRVDFGTEPTKSEPKEAAVITQASCAWSNYALSDVVGTSFDCSTSWCARVYCKKKRTPEFKLVCDFSNILTYAGDERSRE